MEMTDKNRVKYSLHPNFAELLEVWSADSISNIKLNEKGDRVSQESKALKLGQEILRRINLKKDLIEKLSSGKYIISETKLAPGIKIGQISQQIKIKIVLGEIKNESDAKNFLKKSKKST
jgi:cell division protein YceG involved in septum cleavage